MALLSLYAYRETPLPDVPVIFFLSLVICGVVAAGCRQINTICSCDVIGLFICSVVIALCIQINTIV